MRKVSIIIPVFNEEKTLLQISQKVLVAPVWGLEKEIIIVDNGSTDNSLNLAQKIAREQSNVKVFTEKERGKGAAMKLGFKVATGDILLAQDADLEYDPADYQNMIKPIIEGQTEVVNGVREKRNFKKGENLGLYLLSRLGNWLITVTTNILYLNKAGEYEGCYKAFTKKTVDSVEIKTNDFDFDNELVCQILKRGYKTIDVPIKYNPRNYSEGKKINWRHGFKILWTVIKIRFTN